MHDAIGDADDDTGHHEGELGGDEGGCGSERAEDEGVDIQDGTTY